MAAGRLMQIPLFPYKSVPQRRFFLYPGRIAGRLPVKMENLQVARLDCERESLLSIMVVKKWLQSFLYMTFTFTGLGQQLPLQTWSPANGLCDARLLNMYQDSMGRLYFMSKEGFSMHDGQRITNFTQLNNQPIGYTNYIHALDRDELLVSALSGLYILRNGVLKTDSARFGTIAEPGRIIPAGGRHLLITSNAGLYYYNGRRTRRLNTAMITVGKVQLNLEQAFLYGRLLLFNCWTDMDRTGEWRLYDIDKELVIKRIQIPGLQGISADDRGRMITFYKGRWQQPDAAGLQGGELKFTDAWFNRLLPPYLPADVVQIKQGHVWLYRGGNGFLRINSRTGQKEQYRFEQGISDKAFGVFEDREGNNWFISDGQGAQKLLQPGIEPFSLQNGQPLLQVRSLLQTGAGEPSFAAGDKIYIQRATGAIASAQLPPVFQQGTVLFWNGSYRSLHADSLLLSSTDTALQLYKKGDTVMNLSKRMVVDAQNRLVLCGAHLVVITPGNQITSVTLPYFTDNVCIDGEGNYWCFTRGGHAACYRLGNNQLQPVFMASSGLSARATMYWNRDSFLIGTRNNGLYWAVVENRRLRIAGNISTGNGLSNNFILALARRGTQEILTGTGTGMDIIRFSATDTSVERMLSRINVFQSVSSIVTEPSGRAWIYCDDGRLYLLLPAQPQQALSPPNFFLNSILVNGNPVNGSSENRFAYNRNNFRFSVSAPSFIDEKNIRFRFLLSGSRFNQEQQGEKADFEITNLPPGSYALTATAVFPGNRYPQQTIRYAFRIQKPFWKTAGFIAGCIMLLLTLIYSIFRTMLNRRLLRQRVEMEKQQAVSHERTRIATDMHDDLGAGLSAIKFLSQGAPYISPETQKDNNVKISKYADELVDKMNDIIWAMNEKNDALDNLIFYCKAWVTEYCDAYQLAGNITVPQHIPAMSIHGQLRQNIFLCIKEAVHNIIKHAAADKVEMQMLLDNSLLRIEIKDDGRGFDPERVKGGNGLYNMQKRMTQVNGRMTIVQENGTAIVFEVPL
jgi:signal transduction histidine kinase